MRFIPARAGNTAVLIAPTIFQPVHPRACGEHAVSMIAAAPVLGSSPRVRGTRASRAKGQRHRQVHPRACGEHTCGKACCTPCAGSSPRVRGTRFQHAAQVCLERFIPARAGNTHAASLKHRYPAVHPRACGEHHWHLFAFRGGFGSSPRVRGTLFLQLADFTIEISLALRYRSW